MDFNKPTQRFLILFGIIWSIRSSTALPERTYDAYIAGNDSSLNLINGSVCANFTGDKGLEFQRFIIHDGNIYIGATNHILQVDLTSFEIEETVSLGPYDDDVDCLAPSICSSNSCGELKCVDNKNRLLLPHRNQLITCGTTYAGTCDILRLTNISQPYLPEPSVDTLKCLDASQITRHSSDLAVAALYSSTEDATKDLLYVGIKGSTDALFPPGYSVAEFTKIDKTDNYATKYADRTFIKAWVTDVHNFMLWTSKNGDAFITRLCHTTLNEFSRKDVRSDEGYGKSSYTETTIECNGFKNATLAHYRYNKLYVLLRRGNNYIIGSKSLDSINAHFNDAREDCFKGGTTMAKYIYTKKEECREIPDADASIKCGLAQEYYQYMDPIKCKNPLEFDEEFVWPDEMAPPTTIAVDYFAGSHVGFFGTENGEILKAIIGTGTSEFTEKIILKEGKPVSQDVGFDESQNIYAMTSDKIFKVSLSNCGQYETCGTCVSSKDPYCGWCVLQSKCMHKSECEYSDRPTNWLRINASQSECPRVAVVAPNALSVAVSQKLSLTFSGSTLPDTSYDCEFLVGDISLSTSPLADYPSSPSCFSPADPPTIPDNRDNVNVLLRIKAGKAVVAIGQIDIYDCNKIPSINQNTMCGSCVTSPWSCSWCSNTNTCEDTCPDSAGISTRDQCPTVTEVINATVDVPVGKPQEFMLITTNLPKTQDFNCVLSLCDSEYEVTVPGSRDGDGVTCNIPKDELTCEKEDSSIILSLKSNNYIVDTPRAATVTVNLFNCSGAASECGVCIISHKRHRECTWCDNICVPEVDCEDVSVTDIESCPVPVINSMYPLNGPINGGTEITLDGVNLASSLSEIVSVTIDSNPEINCTILTEKYIPSKSTLVAVSTYGSRVVRKQRGGIVCVTESTDTITSTGLVKVNLSYTDTDVISNQQFTFKEVTVFDFEPKYAVLGTKITITGTNLDVGNSAEVRVTKDAVSRVSQCNDRLPNQLVCLLPEVPNVGEYSLWTSLDRFTQRMLGELEYVSQPNISSLVGREKLVSFFSGGITVTFKMTSLLGVQSVILQVEEGEAMDCILNANDSTVQCPLPAMASLNKNGKRSRRAVPAEDDTGKAISRAAEPTKVSAEIVANDQIRIPLSGDFSLSYVNNPSMNSLASMPCHTGEDTSPTELEEEINGTVNSLDWSTEPTASIQLTGKYLDFAAVKEDYTVTIQPLEGEPDSVMCVPSFLETESLICKAKAAALSKYEGKTVLVTVKVGNLTFPLQANYCLEGTSSLSTTIIVIICVVVALLLVIIIGLLVLYCHKNRKQRKEREQIMKMLDSLENKTRENARNAYVELQLGYMTTLTDNLSDSITYLPPVSCFMRALFNDWTPDHPMLNSEETSGMPEMKIAAFDEFIQLLKRKDFLITLIKTLEEQKHFAVKEKGQFASLLTVCLFDDMVYFTNIMLELLSDLVQKHVAKTPKLLLRRSESVVEKMLSHWLCINLYSECIKEQAGKPLYLLTKAIHFLVNSAPSDVVANKAVNSLNEMTLLGSEITYEVITLKACVVDKGTRSEEFDVKVVNCDTITQVKEKIIEVVYRDRPFSENPKPDEMELEMVAGKGHLLLSDIDNMSKEEGNYTMINTLKYYNVPDGATVLLSPAKNDSSGAEKTGSPPTTQQKRRLFHLMHPRDKESNGFVEDDDTGNKTKKLFENLINQPFQEIYLTRMVKSKATVQEYVDAVFNSILTPVPISKAVKYFFQFLDKEAAKHKISDPEVVHIWKTNSLLLRYWVNILKNPEFLFDINKTAIVDSCLNVITQAFMDACATTSHKLGQDSPSNKLLYAKDSERYKKMVTKFFENAAGDEPTTDEELNESLRKVSANYASDFNQRAAAQQLYQHLDNYRSQVQTAVHELDNQSSLSNRLNSVIEKLSPETNGHSHGKTSYDTSILV